MILTSLDYIPINIFNFLYHFKFLLSYQKIKIRNNIDNILYGYSCRSLFDTLLNYYTQENPDLKILTTPIHHTSFMNIIEKYIKKENINILPLNEKYNSIRVTENVLKKNYDLCVISHLFGQDLGLDNIELIKNNNTNCIFIEDRVQGGKFSKKYSNNIFNISLYSTGMDKKPCGLGGGILYTKNEYLINFLEGIISKYDDETKFMRLFFLIKKIPTYLFYNVKTFIYCILKLFKYYEWDLNNFCKRYRKNNPGFDHDNYNLYPNNSTLLSIEKSLKNVLKQENLYIYKFTKFIDKIKNENLLDKIPWYRGENLLTVYNTIYINKNREKFINYLNSKYIQVIENPTYKVFNFDYENKDSDVEFNNSIIYLPSIINMNENEMDELVNILKNYDLTLTSC